MALISIITTVINEEESVIALLESILRQTRLPDEVVIVDGGSSDRTVEAVENFIREHSAPKIRILVKRGNRSVGRNAAIEAAIGETIAVTDGGCTLDPHWLQMIVEPIEHDAADFVGGWFTPRATTSWQRSLVKVLNYRVEVVNLKTFLPSTRSMAFKKELWKRVGGFDERLAHNEDTPFAIAAKRTCRMFAFQPSAIVYWNIARSYSELFRQVKRYAYGDGESGVFASHYLFLFAWIVVTALSILGGTWNPFFFALALVWVFSYLYLPLLTFGFRSLAELWYIPTIKSTLIAAHIVGFLHGSLRRL